MRLNELSAPELAKLCAQSQAFFHKGQPLNVLEQKALLLALLQSATTRQEQGYQV